MLLLLFCLLKLLAEGDDYEYSSFNLMCFVLYCCLYTLRVSSKNIQFVCVFVSRFAICHRLLYLFRVRRHFNRQTKSTDCCFSHLNIDNNVHTQWVNYENKLHTGSYYALALIIHIYVHCTHTRASYHLVQEIHPKRFMNFFQVLFQNYDFIN